MATVYRSVKVVFQNSTNVSLTVQGVATLRGQWTDKLAPKQGDEITEQSAATWGSESVTIGSGTHAFVRLGSLHGYTKVTWYLPWVGEFSFTHDHPEGLHLEVTTDDREPDAVVVSVTLQARRGHCDEGGGRGGPRP